MYVENKTGKDFVVTNIPARVMCVESRGCGIDAGIALIASSLAFDQVEAVLGADERISLEPHNNRQGIPTITVSCVSCGTQFQIIQDNRVHPAITANRRERGGRLNDVQEKLSPKQRLVVAAASKTPYDQLPQELKEEYARLRAEGSINKYY
jgi:hypothetical protein